MLSVVKDIKPRDHFECMLAAQAAAVHVVAMRFANYLIGGAPGSGAPKQNRNAFKHGLFTKGVIEERKQAQALIGRSRKLLQDIDVNARTFPARIYRRWLAGPASDSPAPDSACRAASSRSGLRQHAT